MTQPKELILASTSIYRKAQLEKLGLAFKQLKPTCDEESEKLHLLKQNLPARQIAEGLSFFKGHSLFKELTEGQNSSSITLISGDQLIHFNGKILGKSHTYDKAVQQLLELNNQTHELITSIHIFNQEQVFSHTNITQMTMRNLSRKEIEAYVHRDQTTDCAGSYKIELSGVALFSQIQTDDFTAIQGLPMIWLTTKLKELNYELFHNS